MNARELAAILMRYPDLPVRVVNDDYSRSDVARARLHRERLAPGGEPQPAGFDLCLSRPDWED